jgi:hypothetical protein
MTDFDLTAHIASRKVIDDTTPPGWNWPLEKARMLPGRVVDPRAWIDAKGRADDLYMDRLAKRARRDDWSMWIGFAWRSLVWGAIAVMSISLARVIYALMTGAYQ